MKNYKFKVEDADSGVRIDQFLVKNLSDKSRSYIQRLITTGLVFLNNKYTKPHYKLKPFDEITVNIPEQQPAVLVKPQDIPLDIIYEDEHIIVVNKPAGMVVHPAAGNLESTLVNALLYHCKHLASSGAPLRPGIVHRLDKDVSGLLVVAKTDESYNQLIRQFKERKIKRIYVALVKGIVQLDEGIIDLPVGRHPIHRKKMTITYSSGKSAQTHYKVLKRFKDYTMLELTLGTGRTHQIRIHMAHLGHSILGDSVYGTGGKFKLGRLALHAKTLGFAHPVSGKNLEFEAPLPAELELLIK